MHLTLNYTQAYVSVIDPMYLQSTLYIYLQHVQNEKRNENIIKLRIREAYY